MPEDTRPIPRLPLDTASVTAYKPGELNAMLVEEPGEPIVHVGLLETRTPEKYAKPAYAAIYNRSVGAIHANVAAAQTEAEKVLTLFDNDTARPPQFKGTKY